MKITTASNVPTPTRRLVANGGGVDRNVFETEFDPGAEPPSWVVVDAVAFIHNADPVDLDPLADAVDPDALDALLDPGADDASPVDVTFRYEGLQISITSGGRLWLRWDDHAA